MPTENAPGKDVQAAIVREQVHLAFRHLPTMQLASFVVALVLAYAVRNVVPRANIALWLLMVLAVVTSRIVFYSRYAVVRDQPFDGRFWEKAYLLLALASGIIWGLSAFIVFPAGNYVLIALLLLAIASLSAATTVSHSSIKLGPAAWMAPVLLFYAVRCFIEGGEASIIGVLIIIYFLGLLSHSFNHHKTITSSIALRFENLKLLGDVQKSEERFRLLFQRHNAVMLLVDPATGGIVDANAAAERFYGYPAGQLKRMNLQDINMLTGEEIRSARLQALREERNCFLFPHRLANGQMRTVEVHTSPIQTGDKVLLFSIIHDITERKQAEERLRSSEASYRNLFDSITDAICILDEEGRILDVNKGAEAVYGRERDFLLGRTPETFAAAGMNDRTNATKRPRKTAGAPLFLTQLRAFAQRFRRRLCRVFSP